ncbi:hypothetical protein B0T16DRAFT_162572 [Cercophora newfieldiana]|uniref:Uncharacterized protein n=1 Tax=Cercophora newfieldiana TaxID=92897 RepID=A0AA39Y5M1_9PEZI|nr:hypothetical protein B0T16DRAFT_162572 [Cercophora newfieldiana]
MGAPQLSISDNGARATNHLAVFSVRPNGSFRTFPRYPAPSICRLPRPHSVSGFFSTRVQHLMDQKSGHQPPLPIPPYPLLLNAWLISHWNPTPPYSPPSTPLPQPSASAVPGVPQTATVPTVPPQSIARSPRHARSSALAHVAVALGLDNVVSARASPNFLVDQQPISAGCARDSFARGGCNSGSGAVCPGSCATFRSHCSTEGKRTRRESFLETKSRPTRNCRGVGWAQDPRRAASSLAAATQPHSVKQ